MVETNEDRKNPSAYRCPSVLSFGFLLTNLIVSLSNQYAPNHNEIPHVSFHIPFRMNSAPYALNIARLIRGNLKEKQDRQISCCGCEFVLFYRFCFSASFFSSFHFFSKSSSLYVAVSFFLSTIIKSFKSLVRLNTNIKKKTQRKKSWEMILPVPITNLRVLWVSFILFALLEFFSLFVIIIYLPKTLNSKKNRNSFIIFLSQNSFLYLFVSLLLSYFPTYIVFCFKISFSFYSIQELVRN